MKNVFSAMVAAVTAVLCASCATSFTGSAYVEDGRGGCETKCREQGLEFAGMVFMGEYSDACVCGTPGRTGSASRNELLANAAAVAGGTSGVAMQMRRQQEQHQQHAY